MNTELDEQGLPHNQIPVLRVTTRPNDANPGGDIFGGWLMSQIDVASAIIASKRAKGPVVTVAVKELRFIHSIFINDLVSFYGKVVAVGRTSLTVEIEVYSQNQRGANGEKAIKVSDATLVFVAVSAPGKPRPVPAE